jgi:YHS domain-containing protein
MVDVNGIRFRFCGDDCRAKFKEGPMQALRAASGKGWIVGVGVFDPVSGKKLTPQSARGGSSDYQGVRFAFTSSENKAAFDAEPKRFGSVPEKWCSICPIMNTELAHTYGATGYLDVAGVRYFSCCEQCYPRLRSGSQAFGNIDSTKIGPPRAFDVPAVWAKLSGPGF